MQDRAQRLLVVGAGLIGARHVRAVQAHAGCVLAGVVDPEVSARTGWGVPGFADIAAVDVPVDGAIIATPTPCHADHAVAAAARGWHCLVEKPLASDLAAADRIIAASEAAGVEVLVGHHRRHHDAVLALRDLIARGEIGAPVLASLIWSARKPDAYFDTAWRAGAGGSPVMINLVHDIDLLRFLLGEVREVTGFGARPVRGAGRVESGVLALSFRSGATASIAFADTTPSPFGFEAGSGENPHIAASGQDMLWIMGTLGAVTFPSLTLWSGARDWSQKPQPRRVPATRTDALSAQLGHFLAVMAGFEAPLIGARDGRETLAVTLRAEALLHPERAP